MFIGRRESNGAIWLFDGLTPPRQDIGETNARRLINAHYDASKEGLGNPLVDYATRKAVMNLDDVHESGGIPQVSGAGGVD
jgi:hypothetical protein